jgi:hypothetical protein
MTEQPPRSWPSAHVALQLSTWEVRQDIEDSTQQRIIDTLIRTSTSPKIVERCELATGAERESLANILQYFPEVSGS